MMKMNSGINEQLTNDVNAYILPSSCISSVHVPASPRTLQGFAVERRLRPPRNIPTKKLQTVLARISHAPGKLSSTATRLPEARAYQSASAHAVVWRGSDALVVCWVAGSETIWHGRTRANNNNNIRLLKTDKPQLNTEMLKVKVIHT